MQLPALATGKGFDLGRTLATVAALRGQALQNRLLLSKTKRQEKVADLAGQAVREGTGSEAMSQLTALDPQAAKAIMELDDKRAENLRQRTGQTARLLMMVEDTPPEQRPLAYAQARAQAQQMGLAMEGVPEQYNPQWVHQQIKLGLAVDDTLNEREKLKKSDLIKVQTAKGPVYMKASEAEGMPVGETPGVNVTVENYPNVTKKTAGEIETQLLDVSSGLQRLNSIQRQFKPEFQELSTRLSAKWSSIKEKAGFGLDEADKEQLQEFSGFKREAISNLNLYIKQITGAQLSEAEADRLTKGMPNPGTGLFDGDSPTEFKAKLDSTIRELKMAGARYQYHRKFGLAGDVSDIPLDQMPGIMRRREKEIRKELEETGLGEDQIEAQARVRLEEEFGIRF